MVIINLLAVFPLDVGDNVYASSKNAKEISQSRKKIKLLCV